VYKTRKGISVEFNLICEKMKIKKKDQVETLLQPAQVRRIVSFDRDVFAKIEHWRHSRRPILNFSEACNLLLGGILGVREIKKGKAKDMT